MRHEWTDNDRVTIAVDAAGIAQVRMVRTDKLNALDEAMIASLLAAGQALHDWPGLRVVVLAGEGRGFCAGIDLEALTGGLLEGLQLTERTHGNANRFQQLAMQWRKLPCPVIAALHGVCFGAGLQVAAGADIRVAAPDARFAVMESKWGLVPDMGHFALWRGLVRDDLLRELTYTHREFSGEQAVALGFATHGDADPVARATLIAAEIAGCSPSATRAAKSLANRSHDLDTDAILAAESVEARRLIGSRNQLEAVASQLQKRAAQFIEP